MKGENESSGRSVTFPWEEYMELLEFKKAVEGDFILFSDPGYRKDDNYVPAKWYIPKSKNVKFSNGDEYGNIDELRSAIQTEQRDYLSNYEKGIDEKEAKSKKTLSELEKKIKDRETKLKKREKELRDMPFSDKLKNLFQ